MPIIGTISCPDCCKPDDQWRVVGISYTPLNAAATCTAFGGLIPNGECVTGTPEDAVLASTIGSIRISCRPTLPGQDGQPFTNPCTSKNISWISISLEWEFLKADGAVTTIMTPGSCSAVVNVEIEDCSEFAPARDNRDLRVTFFVDKCSDDCL
jgi:hypothetical protein